MNSTSRWWLAATLCAGTGGWLLGHFTASPEPDSAAPGSRRGLQAAIAGQEQRAVKAAAAGEAGPPQSAAQQLATALKTSDRALRLRRFLATMELKTAENTDECNAAWAEYLAEGRVDQSLATLYTIRDGEIRGAKCIEARTGSPVDFALIGAVIENLTGAMKTDPEGVKAWFDSLTNESFREQVRGKYYSLLAAQDLPGAMKLMASDTAYQGQWAGAIVSAVRGNRGSTEMAEWVRATIKAPENADVPWLPAVFEQAVIQTASRRQGAHIGAALLEEFADQPFADQARSSLNQVASQYTQNKPLEALAWAARMEQKLPDPDPSKPPGALVATGIAAASDQSLRSIADWCRNLPAGPDREAAFAALINRASSADPLLAAELGQTSKEQ